METTALRSLKRLKVLYTFCRSAANIWDLHELNLARLGKELLDRLDEVKQQNDAVNLVIFSFSLLYLSRYDMAYTVHCLEEVVGSMLC